MQMNGITYFAGIMLMTNNELTEIKFLLQNRHE